MRSDHYHQPLQQPIKDWPSRNNSGRDAVFAIFIPLALCLLVKWMFGSRDSLLINYGVMLLYLAGLLIGLMVNLVRKSRLNAALGLVGNLTDLESYAQAVNNVATIGVAREFLAYARSVWLFELVFGLGFVASGLFNAFFQ